LAFDFCVRYSSEDAKREGFDVLVIEDACRGIDVEGSVLATRQAFDAIGVDCVFADAIG
ncbi:MAG TPA: nicotinamidase, partial [Casimicrobiaceae bacterium]|nr:nicotinamidase [Casimicrobiaceae bacterium]